MGWIRTNLKVLLIVPGSAWGMLNLWLKLCLCHCFFWWRCQLRLPAMGPLVPEHVFMGPCGMSHWQLKWSGLNITSSFFKLIFSLLPFFTWIIFIIRSCVSCWFFSWREVTQTENPSLNYSPQGIKLVPALRFYHDDCLPGWRRALTRIAVDTELQQWRGYCSPLPKPQRQLGRQPASATALRSRTRFCKLKWTVSLCNRLLFSSSSQK